jgi:ABC-type spermidine/putrescine transport system permease subunit II
MHGSVYKCHYALFLFAALLASFELMYRPVECIMNASIATSGRVQVVAHGFTVVFYGALFGTRCGVLPHTIEALTSALFIWLKLI